MAVLAGLASGAGAGIVSGLLGGLFGGGGSGADPQLEALYKKFNSVLDLSMGLYKTASGTGPDSLKSQDKQALADYQQAILTQAQASLGAYDAAAAASGSPINMSDTSKERARNQISAGFAQDVAQKQYSQTESLTAREAALLPNPSSYAQGFSGAGQIDAANAQQQSSLLNSILNLAGGFGGQKTPATQNPTWNLGNPLFAPGSAAYGQNQWA